VRRSSKSARANFKKAFVAVRDTVVYIFDKQSDASNLASAVAVFDLKSKFLMVRSPTATQIRNIEDKELACTFMIVMADESAVGKSSSSIVPSPASSSVQGAAAGSALVTPTSPAGPPAAKSSELSKAELEQKIKSIKADRDHENKMLTGAKQMIVALEVFWGKKKRKGNCFVKNSMPLENIGQASRVTTGASFAGARPTGRRQ